MKLKRTLAGAAVAFSLALTAWLPGGTVNPTAAVGMYMYDVFEFYGVSFLYTPPVCSPLAITPVDPGQPGPSLPPCFLF